MKSKMAVMLMVVTVCLLVAGPLSARGFGKHLNVQRLAEPLDLDSEQINAIEKIQDNTMKQVLDIRRELEYKQYEMKKLMSSEDPKISKIYSLIDDIHKLKADIQKARVGSMLDIKAQLTPEQADKLQELRTERRQNRQQRGSMKRQQRMHRFNQDSGWQPGNPPVDEE
ncbi:periplasmic heavy metal sensor [Acidobacteriota bacterium]